MARLRAPRRGLVRTKARSKSKSPSPPNQEPTAAATARPWPPLSLALENDSTAFIVDKFARFLPHHPHKQQMHYLVRWSDLPAAALAVPATEILDYVSPRVLEDYEHQLSLEDDQPVQQELGKSRLKHARDRPTESQKPAESQTKATGPPRKRGRPRRAPFQPSPSLLSTGHVAAAGSPPSPSRISGPPPAATPKKGTEPSLSTPQKAFAPSLYADGLAEDLTSGIDDEEADLEEALTQQLSRRNEYDAGTHEPAVPSSGFTPVGRAVGLWGPQKHSRSPELERTSTPASDPHKEANPKSHRKKRRKLSKPGPEFEPAWEVKRLEGHRISDVDGQLVRFFKVRWEGDWPPSENPTWEPEENLHPELVKQYLKKKAKAERADTDFMSPLPIPPRPPRKYSSVAEAFEGEIEESQHQLAAADAVESDHDDRLLVEEDDLAF
ncbi:chromo domain-containing protein [Apiospora hydei]|uniref:Chromo domain-containing protein n=1 Tax=Apiospora hydei TaxID=1337664 RepID=A0ABR1X0T1_9PEZI